MKTQLKRILRTVLPRHHAAVQARWTRFRCEHRDRRLAHITQAVVNHYGLVVTDGPFAGMNYVPRAIHSGFTPKLLGCYEDELRDLITELVGHPYTVIVDVGSAEGYYAIGFARALPRSRVYAFDIDPLARQLCEDMARANQVSDRVEVGGACDVERLRSLPLGNGGRALIISDCEGYEGELLRPDLVPDLAGCDLLVELHDPFVPGTTPTLLARFADSHDVTLINSVAHRDPSRYPKASILPKRDRALAVDDLRMFAQQWAFFQVKNTGGNGAR